MRRGYLFFNKHSGMLVKYGNQVSSFRIMKFPRNFEFRKCWLILRLKASIRFRNWLSYRNGMEQGTESMVTLGLLSVLVSHE